MTNSLLFVAYPRCSTCRKAQAWLDAQGVAYTMRHIVEDNPSADELAHWHKSSGLSIRRLFNTSGMRYRELGVKARLDAGMSDDECYDLLASDGMLVRRPILVGDDFTLFGFQEAAWKDACMTI